MVKYQHNLGVNGQEVAKNNIPWNLLTEREENLRWLSRKRQKMQVVDM